MKTSEAFYDPTDIPMHNDTREFEKAILQTAIIYRIAQYRQERKKAAGCGLGEVVAAEEQSSIYQSMLFALIDEWLAEQSDAPAMPPKRAAALASRAGRRPFQLSREALHN